MKFFRIKLFFVFLSLCFLLAGCTADGSGANQNVNGNSSSGSGNLGSAATKDDPEEFGRIVNLNFTPEEVSWRETEGQNQKKLVAVIKFFDPDAQAVISQAERHKPAEPAELYPENWFPPELIAKSQVTGAEILKGTAYAANDFFSDTFKNGKLTRIADTNYFILELNN